MSHSIHMHEQFSCARPLEEVFDYVVDFSRVTQWDHTITQSRKVTNGPVGLGTKFDLIFAMGPRRIPIAYEITQWDYPKKAVLTGTSENFTAVDTVTLTESDKGCHLDWDAKLDFTGMAAKVVTLMEKKIVSGGVKTIRDLEVALTDDFDVPSLSKMSKLADSLVLPGVLSFSKMGYAVHKSNWNPVSASIKGKHAVITGATSGLGLSTAESLAHLGAHLTLVARDKDKAKAVAQKIRKQTGNANITVAVADLSLIADVKKLTRKLLRAGEPIDILVNNAGALFNQREVTSEGLEKSFALLLLAPTVLTERLRPLLKKSGSARVINVASGGMYATRISVPNLESSKGDYRGTDAYARAKRGLVIKGEQWAEAWAKYGITVHNMHPGWAQTPGVESSLPGFTKITRRILRTPAQGADTIVWLATATEAAKTSGLFWLDRIPHSTHLVNKTRETPAQRNALIGALDDYAERFK